MVFVPLLPSIPSSLFPSSCVCVSPQGQTGTSCSVGDGALVSHYAQWTSRIALPLDSLTAHNTSQLSLSLSNSISPSFLFCFSDSLHQTPPIRVSESSEVFTLLSSPQPSALGLLTGTITNATISSWFQSLSTCQWLPSNHTASF